jgi:hypothetical protein
MMEKIAIGVVATSVALVLCAPAQADNDQDRQFLSTLTSAGWSINNASGLISQGHMVCNEGLAHGVSWQEIRTTLMGYGYSSLDSSTLITQAVSVYCPQRKSAIAGMDSGARTAGPSTNDEWWDTPSMGQAACAMVKRNGRDWAVNNGIGDFNGTAEGAHFVDALIAKYCPQYAD